MLTITEESARYPLGQIPNLKTDQQEYQYVQGRLVGLGGNASGALELLAGWSADVKKFKRTFATWAAAAQAALETPQPMLDPAVQARRYANCGQTSEIVLESLQTRYPALAGLKRNAVPVSYDTGNRANLRQVLVQVPAHGNFLLLDCSFPAVHTFLLEVHPDGRRYLVQGYQGAYRAPWWQGTDDASLVIAPPINPHNETQVTKYNQAVLTVTGARAVFGLGQAISAQAMTGLADTLVSAFDDGTWATFARAWPNLPFCPTSGETESVGLRGGAPAIQVTSFTVPGAAGTSICGAVIPAQVGAL
jgi:hypothetical protein